MPLGSRSDHAHTVIEQRDELLPGGDEVTPTLKLTRQPISGKYADAIERLYAP